MKNNQKVVIASLTDTHTNSTVALCAPEVAEDDGGTRKFSKTQAWLWNCLADFRNEIKRRAKSAKIYSFLGGDIADLDAPNRSSQIISRNPKTIKTMCITTLSPIIEISDRVFMTRGTSAHDGKSSWMEELVGEDCGAEKQEDNYSSWEWNVNASGVLCNIIHHAKGDAQSVSASGAAVRISRGIMLQCSRLNKPMPKLAIRGHVHFYHDSFDTEPVRTIILPAWTTQTEYGYRISNGVPPIADIGGLIATCENGKITDLVVKRYHPLPATTWSE